MRIVIDEAIWGVPGLFEPLGEVVARPGRAIGPADLSDADALIVRSVTRVDAALLAGSRVRFVGTATSGIDHVDTAWLATHGIAFADAAGCNRRAVAEYVIAALLEVAFAGGYELAGRTLGVVGAGRIGSLVAEWGQVLGMRALVCDPPRERQGVSSFEFHVSNGEPEARASDPGPCRGSEGPAGGSTLDPLIPRSLDPFPLHSGPFIDSATLRREADFVTLHVPLAREGPDATAAMVDAAWLAGLKSGAVLINTSRGEVVVERDLRDATAAGPVGRPVLDVWANEPNVDLQTLAAAAIATPHLAGYTADAKRRAAEMMVGELSAFCRDSVMSKRLPKDRQPADLSATPASLEAGIPSQWSTDDSQRARHGRAVVAPLRQIVRTAFDISAADGSFREALQGCGGSFDSVRADFSMRREFPQITADTAELDDASLLVLSHLGFRVDGSRAADVA